MAPLISKIELRGVLTGLALVAVGLLLAISVPIGIPVLDVLPSLRFHIGVALLALPILLLLVGARWRALLLAALILASLGQGALVVYRQLQGRAAMATQSPLTTFSLLSFNVLSGNPRGGEIADYITSTLPDIAVIMETPGIEDYLPKLAADYPYRVGCANTKTCDLSLLSRTPLRGAKMYLLKPFERERLITAQTTINGQDVTLVAVHLSKPYFDEAAWGELWQVQRLLATISGPVVLTGDFNAAVWSNPVAAFVATNKLVPPPYFVPTWPVKLGPLGVPIDNMFSRDGALIEDVTALDTSHGSNHRGLLAHIAIMDGP